MVLDLVFSALLWFRKVLNAFLPVYQNVTPSAPSVLWYLQDLILHVHSDRAQKPGKAETYTRMS